MAKTGIQISTGERVYQYTHYTYGVISYDGIAVTSKKNKHPFFEINENDIIWDGEYKAIFPDVAERKKKDAEQDSDV